MKKSVVGDDLGVPLPSRARRRRARPEGTRRKYLSVGLYECRMLDVFWLQPRKAFCEYRKVLAGVTKLPAAQLQ